MKLGQTCETDTVECSPRHRRDEEAGATQRTMSQMGAWLRFDLPSMAAGQVHLCPKRASYTPGPRVRLLSMPVQ